MGGGGLNVPKELWSWTGGFNADPRRWRRNTALAGAALLALAVPIFYKSIELETRHARPHGPVPSQRWAPHTFPKE